MTCSLSNFGIAAQRYNQRRGPQGQHYGALFIEMKSARGQISPAQEMVHGLLRAAGYLVVVCYGAQAAIDALTHYLEEIP